LIAWLEALSACTQPASIFTATLKFVIPAQAGTHNTQKIPVKMRGIVVLFGVGRIRQNAADQEAWPSG
jgi:hypothetical protein